MGTLSKRQSADPTADWDEFTGTATLTAGTVTVSTGFSSVDSALALSQANETLRYSVSGGDVTFTSSNALSTATISYQILGKR